MTKVGRGEAHIGAGGLFQAASANPQDLDPDRPPAPAWSAGYHAVSARSAT